MYTQDAARTLVNQALSGRINGRTPRNFTIDTRHTACYTSGTMNTQPKEATTMTATAILSTLSEKQAAWITDRALNEVKFTEDTLAACKTNTLADVAQAYASGYVGSFEFLQKVQREISVHGAIPAYRVPGTLNCFLAEIRRTTKPAVKVMTLAELPQAGVYTVTVNGATRTIELSPTKDKDGILMMASYLDNSDNMSEYRGFAWIRTDGSVWTWKAFKGDGVLAQCLKALLAGDETACILESRTCHRCGHRLTAKATLENNVIADRWYGPECIKHVQ